MHFDDRLATVLRKRPRGDAIARIQYRQLLDILGTLPLRAAGPRIDEAHDRLTELESAIPLTDRARMLQEPTLRLRNPRLVAQFADDHPTIASAAIGQAQLTEKQWLDLIPALPVRARGILRHRRGLGPRVEERLERLGVQDRGLPPAEGPYDLGAEQEVTTAEEPEVTEQEQSETGIGAIVKRIEAFRKQREGGPGPAVPSPHGLAAPRLPLGDAQDGEGAPPPLAFDFATDAEGRIIRASTAVAPMVVGIRLAGSDETGVVRENNGLAVRLRQRQPLFAVPLELAGAPAIAGQWQADATPRFDPQTGRFLGYAGRMRRPVRPNAEDANADAARETDRMRQMLHELRTPLNAIQLGAEVIQQQLYGPTPHEYRALAATVAGDAARIMAGFDELERLVKLNGGALELETGQSDLIAVLTATVSQLEAHTGPRKSGFVHDIDAGPLPIGIERIELERLVWRLLAALAGAAAPSEFLELNCKRSDAFAEIVVSLPCALSAADDEALFHARAEDRPSALSAGMFGLGFTLRLAAAEAKAAGGSLTREGAHLRLALPLADGDSANLSQA